MQHNVTFYLSGKYIHASVYCLDGRAAPRTGQKTDTGLADLPRNIQRVLDRIRLRVDEYVGRCQRENRQVLKKDVEGVVKEAAGKKIKSSFTIGDIIQRFYDGAASGAILNKKGKLYPGKSLDGIKDTQRVVCETSLNKLNIANLKPFHFDTFRSELVAKGMTANSIQTYNNMLLAVINRSSALGWHDNSMRGKEGVRYNGEDVDYAIYYTKEELDRLYKYRFKTKMLSEVRDVFIFGCYTCLRHSDYYITDYTLSVKDGILTLVNKKTGKRVDVPLHPLAKEILEKYKYRLPAIKYDTLNTNVKEMAKQAGFGELCLFHRTEGGKPVSMHVPKWKLTTTHTMRRSFATNALLSMMPERMIMRIGGWKSYTSFERYIRLSGLDMAKLALEQPFYKWV